VPIEIDAAGLVYLLVDNKKAMDNSKFNLKDIDYGTKTLWYKTHKYLFRTFVLNTMDFELFNK